MLFIFGPSHIFANDCKTARIKFLASKVVKIAPKISDLSFVSCIWNDQVIIMCLYFLIEAGGSLWQLQGWQEPGYRSEEVLPSGGELLQTVPQRFTP